ncbi:DUF4352 domain-containing protein [Candidatus Micrarchaeota archaeon]|nr:DUF4352 domain-containing protein [Candidatus Micrarchaeota archaeon]
MEIGNGQLAILLLLGIMLFSFGCGGDDHAPPEPLPQEGTADNGSAPVFEDEPLGENVTECYDGTPVGNCSATKPKACDITGNLVDDVETCGCPENAFQMGDECIYYCADGTPLGECSKDKPYYCNMSAELYEGASICGCPEGYDAEGEGCRNACDDGTAKEVCSEQTPPYYCNREYELVLNPSLCGCFEWEFMVSGSCYDPTAIGYSNGETIRLSEDVSAVIDKVEELDCEDSRYLGVRLTITNNGDEAFAIEESDVRAYKNNRYRMFSGRPEGCAISSIFRWGEVNAGGEKTGRIYFDMGGGIGDTYSMTISRIYYESILRDFNVTLELED